MRADDLVKLLAARHSKDLFVPECKDGPTIATQSHSRIDAWAMKKSWSKPFTYGYEVKVTRSDFLRDDKWPRYLDLCNQLYFVTPPGLISPDEVPEQAGLICASANCSRLYTKKKAPHREVDIPESLYRYLLICRVKIQREYEYNENQGQQDYWRQWLEEKVEKQELGYLVSRRIKKIYDRMASECNAAKREVERYERFKEELIAQGFDPDNTSTWQIPLAIKQKLKGINLEEDITSMIEKLTSLQSELKEVSGK